MGIKYFHYKNDTADNNLIFRLFFIEFKKKKNKNKNKKYYSE